MPALNGQFYLIQTSNSCTALCYALKQRLANINEGTAKQKETGTSKWGSCRCHHLLFLYLRLQGISLRMVQTKDRKIQRRSVADTLIFKKIQVVCFFPQCYASRSHASKVLRRQQPNGISKKIRAFVTIRGTVQFATSRIKGINN